MFIPFRQLVDETFRGDRSVSVKIVGCAAVTAFVVVGSAFQGERQGRIETGLASGGYVALGGTAAGVGALLGLFLSMKDVVRRRLDRGDRVHPILALYFGKGLRSRVVGIATLAIVIVAVIGRLF